MWIDELVLSKYHEPVALDIWVPKTKMVVLGAANLAEMEVHETFCRNWGIPLLKRAGGGGTVVLYPGCVIVSLGCWVKQHFQNRIYFQAINAAVLQCLSRIDALTRPLPWQQRGVSDLCVADFKFGGTSMFRSKNYLLYQASLICDRDSLLIDECLKHPSREPDYRAGRPHRNFLKGLEEWDSVLTVSNVAQQLQVNLVKDLTLSLADQLIEPCSDQFANLDHRLKAGEVGQEQQSLLFR